ncbi:Retrovirus-related Gag polyprotein from transposon gypsy [Eumeta japonica]|uniref:Retrovirus-related Gag polyprotein from transposon gypsy n=1 Tax=Eumeta variegata TaxID=151549 RepID=A0A4C1T479_EUMVA|nr:Retrovirus-related Gag polyprotein from transposon gypsy [Eumeta japonica]
MAEEIATLRAQIELLTQAVKNTQVKVDVLEEGRSLNINTREELQDFTPNITDANQINLKTFETIPCFSGDKNQYRSWRKRAWTFMENIKQFSNHPNYYTAFTIVHSKIIGEAADILINHNTKMNFYSIINRLDYTYADQRPLYVLLEEMKRITQGRRTLSEFHSEVSKALNLALSKIEMSGDVGSASMLEYANQEAVRTFITGLNSKYTSGTLYSHHPKDLEAAYAIASTIHHDNTNMQFDTQAAPQRFNQRQNYETKYFEDKRRYNPNIQVQRNHQPRPEPMEVDNSQQYRRPTQYHGGNNSQHQYNPFRRDQQTPKRNRPPSSRNHYANKVQRVNQTTDENFQSITTHTDDVYETGSAFLGE